MPFFSCICYPGRLIAHYMMLSWGHSSFETVFSTPPYLLWSLRTTSHFSVSATCTFCWSLNGPTEKKPARNLCWPFSFVLHRHFKMPQNGAIPVATGMRRPQCCCYRRHGHASIPLPAWGWMRPRVSHRGPRPLVPGGDAADSSFCSVNSLATRKSQCPTSLPQHFHPQIPQHCEKMNLSCSETVLEAAILQLSCLLQS